MTARPNKSSAGRKRDIKTTVIIVLLVLVAVEGFMLYNKYQEQKKKPAVAAVKPKAQPVKPAPKKITTTSVAPVKQTVKSTEPVVSVVPVEQAVRKPLTEGKGGRIAFVIDDWGYSTKNCDILKEIKAPIAVAILPNLRRTSEVEECAHAAGKLIMLHLPMLPYKLEDNYPDNYLLSPGMDSDLVEQLLLGSLKELPLAQGVNNHMGSKAMEDKTLVRVVFKNLKKRKLFFMDSMTSPRHSVGQDVAKEFNLPFAARDVFLDNINTREAIMTQMEELADKARSQGYAIAIGHDRELTMQIIKEQVPLLQAKGFKIVSVKDLVKKP